MELMLVPYYTKTERSIDTSDNFDKLVYVDDTYEKYYFEAGCTLELPLNPSNVVTDNEQNVCVAQVEAMLFNWADIFEDDVDCSELMDCILLKNSVNNDLVQLVEAIDDNEIDIDLSGLFCYLKTLYVYPEWRNKGIGTYLFENLQEIFQYIATQPVSTITIYPKPQQNIDGRWVNIKNENSDEYKMMLHQMIHRLQESDFTEIGNSGFYIRSF